MIFGNTMNGTWTGATTNISFILFDLRPPPPPTRSIKDTRTKLQKIEELALRAATAGEREAAQIAIARLRAKESG